MSWFDIASSLLDERAIIETSAIAIGSSFTALFYFLFRRTFSHAKKVKNAKSLNIDDDLPTLIQNAPSSCMPYVALTGSVDTFETPLSCKADNTIKGVIWKKTTTEHKDIYHKYTHSWNNITNEISSVSDSIPFHLIGETSAVRVIVSDPLQSSWIEDSIEVVDEQFHPATSTAVENFVGYISGDRLKGYTDTERMLKLGSKLCAIGELVYENNSIKIRPPLGSSSEYIVTKLSQKEIVNGIERKAKLWKIFSVVLLAASATGLYFLIRRLRRRYKEVKDEQKNSKKLSAIRKQRTAIAARLNRDPSHKSVEPCVICLSNPRECVLLDCGHICVCVDCLEALPSPKECPICRSTVIRTVPLFNA